MVEIGGNGIVVLKRPSIAPVSQLLSSFCDVSLEPRFGSLRTLGSMDSLNPLQFGDVVVVTTS